MKFNELWRASRKVYKEISFQAIFSLRSGGILPQGEANIKRVVRNAEVNTLLSKLLTTAFLAFSAVLILLLVPTGVGQSPLSIGFSLIGSVSAFLAMMLVLIAIMGIQISTALVSSRIVEALSPLPLSKQDVSKIVFLSFLMVFDVPLISAIPVFLVIYAILGGTPFGGMAAFLGIVVTEIFAITFTIGLAKFFYAKVTGSSGKSKWKTVMRLLYMLVWILPSFGAYFVTSFSVQIVEAFASFSQFFSLTQLISVIYPFSYGFLVSFATFYQITDWTVAALSLVASLGYLALAVLCVRWVTRVMKDISLGAIGLGVRERVQDTFVRIQSPWLGIIRKDLRLALRTPSYASLFLLPAIQSVVIAMSFSPFAENAFSTALGVLTGLTFMTLLLPMTMFSMEGLAVAYVKSLPLKERTLILAKAFFSSSAYLISLAVFFLVSWILGKSLPYVLAFGLLHTFSIAAACLLELMLLADKFWKRGSAIGNLYSKLSTYILIWVPGFIMALAPVVASTVVFLFNQSLALAIFFTVAFSEFTLMALLASRKK